MDREKMDYAVNLSKKIDSVSERIGDLSEFEKRFQDNTKTDIAYRIERNYSGVPDIVMSDQEVEVVMALCSTRLKKELSDLEETFKKL
jgi:hypothetical protein